MEEELDELMGLGSAIWVGGVLGCSGVEDRSLDERECSDAESEVSWLAVSVEELVKPESDSESSEELAAADSGPWLRLVP